MKMENRPKQAAPAGAADIAGLREYADQAFSRAAGAPLVGGNDVRLLLDAAENYPAWLDAIRGAGRHVHLENYIIRDDATGRRFADALLERAAAGVSVRVLYDWLGCLGKASRRFWNRLRAGGVEVRSFNPLRLDRPLGWLSRDHRKMLAVDGRVAFITGLCIGRPWEGVPEKKREPWRDTGIALRGPAVREVEEAFAGVWAMAGPPLPDGALDIAPPAPAGDVSLRVVASVPATSGMLRLDLLVAALARRRVWLTDAYYAGVSAYVQALRSAARDGVDVRLLVPGASDLPLVKTLSRAGYRALLEAGVRIFEWNGSMLHAKTAVADGRWTRVGSTNLNVSSWLGNCELDAVIEDEAFARNMEETYLRDLERATEIVLSPHRRVCAPKGAGCEHRDAARGAGSVGRAAAGAIRIGNAIGAAFADRRVLESIEARTMLLAGLLLLALAAGVAIFPRLVAYPLAAAGVWTGFSLLLRGVRLRGRHSRDHDDAKGG